VQTGVLFFLLTFFTSVLLYKNYSFFEQFISELGVGESAFLFNSGLIISAILLLPLSGLLFSKKSTLYKLSGIVGFVSFFALLCIGVFPMGQEPMHFYSALLFFALIALTILLVSLQNSIELKSLRAVFGFISFLIVVFYLINNQSALFQKVAVLFILLWVILQVTDKNLDKVKN
jgi:hypothetical membrane protein